MPSWTLANGTTTITIDNGYDVFTINKMAEIQMDVTEPVLYFNYSVNNTVVPAIRVSGIATQNDITRRRFEINFNDVVSPVVGSAAALKTVILGWLNIVGGASVADGDYGDITVSASGATWTIDNGVVTIAKMANMSTNKLLGRGTAGAGIIEEITLGTGLSFTGTTLNVTGGTGTVTNVSVVSANGFDGTVATATTTPAITITTTITGVLKGNGTAISASTDADITAFLLTGYVSGAGLVAATDSILQAIQKLNGNIVALVTGVSSVNGSTGAVSLALASAQFVNQGTTTTVLHGNAAGNPSWGAVVLTTDVSGTLPIANGGTNAVTAAAALVNLGIVTLKITTGTQTTTAATAQDITGLSRTFAASTVYSVNGMIKIGCNNTGGVVMACTIPSGTMSLEYSGLSSSGGNHNSAEATASGTLTTTARAFCTLNSSAGYVWVKGTITTGVTSGTIKFQYASVTAGQTSSVFQEGTFIQLMEI